MQAPLQLRFHEMPAVSSKVHLRLIFFNIRFLGSFGFFVLLTSAVKPISLHINY